MPDPNGAKSWDRLSACGLGLGFFALYSATLCRTVYWYDSAELVTAAVTLGNTHPPGYPLYALLGHAFTWLPFEPALAVNLMSAAFGGLAVAFVFLVGRELRLDRGPALVGAATLGASSVFWANAVVAEVYCPAVATSSLVLFLLLRALRESRASLCIGAGFTAGLGLGLHMSVATLGAGFAWLVWSNGRDVRTLFASGAAALLGALVFLYVPLRAAQEPPLNICDPSSFEQLVWYLGGGAYRSWFGGTQGLLDRSATIVGSFVEQVGWVGIGVSMAGFISLSRRTPKLSLAFVLMAAGNIMFFFDYQVHDIEVFLLHTTMLLCCFVAVGSQALVDLVAKVAPAGRSRLVAGVASAAFVLLPVHLMFTGYAAANMSAFDETDPFITAASETLSDHAVILNFGTPDEWRKHAVFGMYAQLVRGERTDVRHLIGPDLRKLARDFDSLPRVYAYAPVEMLGHFFDIAQDGPLWRVDGPKPEAETRAPRRNAEARTCGTLTVLEVRDGW